VLVIFQYFSLLLIVFRCYCQQLGTILAPEWPIGPSPFQLTNPPIP
jgi:hypothetical protein